MFAFPGWISDWPPLRTGVDVCVLFVFFFCRAGTRDDGGRDAMQRRHSSNTEGMPAERWAQCVSQAARWGFQTDIRPLTTSLPSCVSCETPSSQFLVMTGALLPVQAPAPSRQLQYVPSLTSVKQSCPKTKSDAMLSLSHVWKGTKARHQSREAQTFLTSR